VGIGGNSLTDLASFGGSEPDHPQDQ